MRSWYCIECRTWIDINQSDIAEVKAKHQESVHSLRGLADTMFDTHPDLVSLDSQLGRYY